MGETPRRSGFRLPWSEAGESRPDQPATEAAAPGSESATGEAAQDRAAAPSGAAPQPEVASQASPFLRELVDAMRGVAETSRDTSLAELRASLDARIEELQAAAAEHAEDLRRRSDHDVTGIGEWERTEIERIRSEAEQRRDARRATLERELADHQATSEAEMEATRRRLNDYERELAAFFAELTGIQDPATFVATAKRMPAPPDLESDAGPGSSTAKASDAHAGPEANGTAASRSETTLSQRLAQLDKQLAATAPAAEPATATAPEAAPEAAQPAPAEPAAAEAPAAGAPAATAPAATTAAPAPAADALTPIVVKGLGSFGAITSFKQALERVDGVRGVTLSLGPTGEFVYRASHAPEFDIVAAIRQIEGPGVGIEEADGQVLVTIERQR